MPVRPSVRKTWARTGEILIPDFTPPDFILCGFLKERLYSNDPKILTNGKDNIKYITEVSTGICQQILRNVARNNIKMANSCLLQLNFKFVYQMITFLIF
jgi:hypothetical protein